MGSEDWIRLEGLTKQYSDKKKISNINLKVERAEIFALCGGNGAGKSTLIKMLTGILKPTAGKVLIEGKEANPASFAYKSMFSYMPDEMVFPRQLTGQEALTFFARLRGIGQDRVSEVLHITGLYEARSMQINHYSKGMQQRLALAQALLPDVPLRILDEPTNGLDPYWVYRFKEIILEEKRLGRTIFFTTHILTLVEELADRSALMHEGEMSFCERVDTLIHKDGGYTPLEKVFFDSK